MSATAPNTATITLPPGYTLESFEFLQGQAVAIAIVTSSLFAIVVWDYFILLPDEIALYRSLAEDNRLWRAPTTYLFIILRYSAILAFLPAIFFAAAQSQHCAAAATLSQVGVVLAVFSSGAIFCFRVKALYSGNRLVQGLVVLCYLFMLSCWISVATTYHAVTGPATPFASNCTQDAPPSWNVISFASSVVFDSIILSLTLAKLKPNLTARQSGIGRRIFRDTLLYFIITTVTNIVVLSIEALQNQKTLIKGATIPFSTLMTVTMGSRVYLNLKLLEHRRRKEIEGIPLSNSGVSSEAATRGTMTGRFAAFTQNELDPQESYVSSAYPPTTAVSPDHKIDYYALTPESQPGTFTMSPSSNTISPMSHAMSPSSRAETLPYSRR